MTDDSQKTNKGLAINSALGMGLGTVTGKGLLQTFPKVYTKNYLMDLSDIPDMTERDAIRNGRRAERLLKTQGFNIANPKNSKNPYDTFHNQKTGKTVKVLHYTSNTAKTVGPHAMPDTIFDKAKGKVTGYDFNHMFVNPTGGKGSSVGALAHELGHTLQGKKRIYANGIGKLTLLAGTPLAGVSGALRFKDPENQRKADMVGKGVTGIATLGGLATLGTELDASYKGYKMMRDSGMLKHVKGVRKNLGSRLGPFVGIPTYVAGAAAPAATYYATRHLPDKIQGLYDSLKKKTQGEQ